MFPHPCPLPRFGGEGGVRGDVKKSNFLCIKLIRKDEFSLDLSQKQNRNKLLFPKNNNANGVVV
jgi:hypothetical protein